MDSKIKSIVFGFLITMMAMFRVNGSFDAQGTEKAFVEVEAQQ